MGLLEDLEGLVKRYRAEAPKPVLSAGELRKLGKLGDSFCWADAEAVGFKRAAFYRMLQKAVALGLVCRAEAGTAGEYEKPNKVATADTILTPKMLAAWDSLPQEFGVSEAVDLMPRGSAYRMVARAVAGGLLRKVAPERYEKVSAGRATPPQGGAS